MLSVQFLAILSLFQLRPCHIGCPDPGHGTKIERGSATAFVTIILNVLASDFNVSTSHLTHVAAQTVRFFIRQCF